jgi:hypothetical protein
MWRNPAKKNQHFLAGSSLNPISGVPVSRPIVAKISLRKKIKILFGSKRVGVEAHVQSNESWNDLQQF